MLIPIKLLLILPLGGLIVLLVLRLRSTTFLRLSLVGIAAIGGVFILFPNLTTAIAHRLGVGRGTDLILYLSIISGFITFTGFFFRMRKLEQNQTEIIRQFAISHASKLSPAGGIPNEPDEKRGVRA